MFHLFAGNVHCKRLFFGGCHDSGYALALNSYAGNPLVGDRIYMVSCGDDDELFSSLPYTTVELPHVFKPVTRSLAPILKAGGVDPLTCMKPRVYESPSVSTSANANANANSNCNINPAKSSDNHDSCNRDNSNSNSNSNNPYTSDSDNDSNDVIETKLDSYFGPIPVPQNDHKVSSPDVSALRTASMNDDEAAIDPEAIDKWRKAARIGASAATSPSKSFSHRRSGNFGLAVYLNIDDERVDPPFEEVDSGIKESMQEKMSYQYYCNFYHLLGRCSNRSCKFVHGDRLTDQERKVLQMAARRMPCARGSACRSGECTSGHLCPDRPECLRQAACKFARFHDVDNTIVSTLKPFKAWKAHGGSFRSR